GEYTREAWGPGGADLDWYCTSNTEAHNGKNPVYLSNRRELIELMNEPAYEILKERCEAIMSQRINNPKNLPLFVIHPATAKR
ncbi:MAG: hypothetical protein RLZZ527_633, partial [Actinomycetota bacterium]